MASMGFIVRVSSFALMVLAIERCHALLKPLRTDTLTTRECEKSYRNYLDLNRSMVVYIPSAVFLYCYGSLIKELYFDSTICTSLVDKQGKREACGFLYCYGSLIKGLYFDNTVCASPADKQED